MVLTLRCHLDIQEVEVGQGVRYLGIITMQMVAQVMTLDGVTEGISKMYLKKKTVPRTEKQPAKEK